MFQISIGNLTHVARKTIVIQILRRHSYVTDEKAVRMRTHHMRQEGAMTAVIEFLSAFTLFLMIVTAFLALAQMQLGANDPNVDRFDQASVDALDRLTSGPGWFTPSIDGVRDVNNSTVDWHHFPASELSEGWFQPGLVVNGTLDQARLDALSNVTLEMMVAGLAIPDSASLWLNIEILESSDSERVGKIIFDDGTSKEGASVSTVASRRLSNSGEVIRVTIELHDGRRSMLELKMTEVHPRPLDGGPEWIEVENENDFAVDLRGWVLNRSSSAGVAELLLKDGILAGGSMMIISGDVDSQTVGNASVLIDGFASGVLGVGSINGLGDSFGRVDLRYTDEDKGHTHRHDRAEWDGTTGILRGESLIQNSTGSWVVTNLPTPGG